MSSGYGGVGGGSTGGGVSGDGTGVTDAAAFRTALDLGPAAVALDYDSSGAVPVFAWTADSSAYDSTGTGSDTFDLTNVLYGYRQGGRSVLRFGGSSYLQAAVNPSRPSSWTVMGAFRADNFAAERSVWGASNVTNVTSWGRFRITTAGEVKYMLGDGSNESRGRTAAGTLTVKTWHVVALVYTAGSTAPAIYVDGALTAVASVDASAATTTAGGANEVFRIGASGGEGSGFFNGEIGAVWYWDSALNATDRAANEALLIAAFP